MNPPCACFCVPSSIAWLTRGFFGGRCGALGALGVIGVIAALSTAGASANALRLSTSFHTASCSLPKLLSVGVVWLSKSYSNSTAYVGNT